MSKNEIISGYKNLPKEVLDLIEYQAKQITFLLGRVRELEGKVRELEGRLKQNSKNSHLPPSSDRVKPQPKALSKINKKDKKENGGQKGHTGDTLKMVEKPDVIHSYVPSHCNCGAVMADQSRELVEKRQVFALPPARLIVSEHRSYGCTCPQCGAFVNGQFPEGVKGPVQYDNSVKAWAALVMQGHHLSLQSARELFLDMYGQPINEATLLSANEKVYEALEGVESQIKEELLASELVHFDESGLRVSKALHWLHVACTGVYTYFFVHPKRGKEALESAASLIKDFQGQALHDCWASYFSFDEIKHATCGSHLVRELEAIKEFGRKWAAQMQDLLLYLYEFSDEGRKTVPEAKMQVAKRKYDRILALADLEEPPPEPRPKGKPKKTKGRNLMERLEKYRSHVLAFAEHKHVPFTNNQAEQDIRPAKIKIKISGCFRTTKGAAIYARIRGFISTMRKNGVNTFDAIKAVLDGNTFLPDLIAT